MEAVISVVVCAGFYILMHKVCGWPIKVSEFDAYIKNNPDSLFAKIFRES